jgi:hypothetical protein
MEMLNFNNEYKMIDMSDEPMKFDNSRQIIDKFLQTVDETLEDLLSRYVYDRFGEILGLAPTPELAIKTQRELDEINYGWEICG